jgi:superfamily II DNA/RNA helicase
MGHSEPTIDPLDVRMTSPLEAPLTIRLDVIRNMGFERMTPVQAGTIPRAMKHQDCVVEVSTNTVLRCMSTDSRR